MTKRDHATLAAAVATFEAFADLQFSEARVVVTEPDGRQIKSVLCPDTMQKLWRVMSAAAVEHIQSKLAEHEAKHATMN